MACLSLLATGIFNVAQAQDAEQIQVQPQEKERKFYLSLGFSLNVVGSDAFAGGNFTFGFMPTPKNLLTCEIGGGSGDSQTIGSYSYTITTTQNGQVVKQETRDDGKITYDYTFFEAMVAWHWVFDMSERWRFRVGPGIGIISVTGSDNYSPTTYDGHDIDGMPTSQPVSQYAPMVGAVAGFTWNFAKRWFLDMNYRLSANAAMNFPERNLDVLGHRIYVDSKKIGSVGNRINLLAGWRF